MWILAFFVAGLVYCKNKLKGLPTMLYQLFLEKITHLLVEKHSTHFVLRYPYQGKIYKLVVPIRRGPCKIDSIHTGDIEITSELESYLGPYHNFHGVSITPKILGYSHIKIVYKNGESVDYSINERIQL